MCQAFDGEHAFMSGRDDRRMSNSVLYCEHGWPIDEGVCGCVLAATADRLAEVIRELRAQAERGDTVYTPCPKCGEEVDDRDGFGVLHHEKCGYCSHPDIYGGSCQVCRAEVFK